LQIGQTRISSSLASTEFLQNKINKGRRKLGFDRQNPGFAERQSGAFYCILLGHQQYAIAEKVRSSAVNRRDDRETDEPQTQPEAPPASEKTPGSPMPASACSFLPGQQAAGQVCLRVVKAIKIARLRSHVKAGKAGGSGYRAPRCKRRRRPSSRARVRAAGRPAVASRYRRRAHRRPPIRSRAPAGNAAGRRRKE
jgi:hypothetical protein